MHVGLADLLPSSADVTMHVKFALDEPDVPAADGVIQVRLAP